MVNTILRIPSISQQTGYARSTIYLRINEGLLPQLIKLGTRASGLPAYEVEAINAARIAGKSADDIRALVKRLEAARDSLIVEGSGYE